MRTEENYAWHMAWTVVDVLAFLVAVALFFDHHLAFHLRVFCAFNAIFFAYRTRYHYRFVQRLR